MSAETPSPRRSRPLSVFVYKDPSGFRLNEASSTLFSITDKRAMLRQIVSDLNFAAKNNEEIFLPNSDGCGGRVI